MGPISYLINYINYTKANEWWPVISIKIIHRLLAALFIDMPDSGAVWDPDGRLLQERPAQVGSGHLLQDIHWRSVPTAGQLLSLVCDSLDGHNIFAVHHKRISSSEDHIRKNWLSMNRNIWKTFPTGLCLPSLSVRPIPDRRPLGSHWLAIGRQDRSHNLRIGRQSITLNWALIAISVNSCSLCSVRPHISSTASIPTRRVSIFEGQPIQTSITSKGLITN